MKLISRQKIQNAFQPLFFIYHFLVFKVRFRWMSRKAIERYQLKRARKITSYAVKHAVYFRKRYKGHDLGDVYSLPTSNKKLMMDNLSDYNTLGFKKKDIIDFCLEIEKTRDFSRRYQGVTVALSSGTSGNKGVEIVTIQEENFLRTLFLSRFPIPRKEKMNLAFILRVSAPAVTLNTFGHRLTYISQLGTLETIRQQLESLQPNAISSPPSMLHILAKEAIAGRLEIQPKFIISYAEVLYPDVKNVLKEVFQCEVYEIYKCTEGAIAISCRSGNLHINEDVVAVQLFNKDGNQTPPGTPCYKMIVTDLFKKSQPIIRYELNDIIMISKEPCSCGSSFRVIERIEGRSDDIFFGKRMDQERLQFIFPDYISRAIISSSEEIEEYQAVQTAPEVVFVRILTRKSADLEAIKDKVKSKIAGVFESYQCQKPNVKVVFEKPVPNPRSSKLIRISREFEQTL